MSDPRHVLVVCAAYAPHPSPTAHRCRFLTGHTHRFGWRSSVLAVDPAYYGDKYDEGLARLAPAGVPVTRTHALSYRATKSLGVGDLALRAYYPMRAALGRLLAADRPDILYFPGWPFYTFRLALWAKREFGVPYVLDYTDPWVCALTPEQDRWTSKAKYTDVAARLIEPPVAREAAHIVGVTGSTHDSLRERVPEIPEERYSATPFGFEASDFDFLRAHPRAHAFWDANDGNLHLVYVGAMLPHGFETLRALFAAFGSLRQSDPQEFGRVRMHFFGTTYDPNAEHGTVWPVAQEMGLGEVVTEHPRRIPYLDALTVLTSADGIVSLGSSERHYTASKIYPCILARRPLLALYHDGSTVKDVIREAGIEEVLTYDDAVRAGDRVPSIVDALRRLVTRARDRTATRAPDLRGIQAYSAERSAEHITGAFDRVLAGR